MISMLTRAVLAIALGANLASAVAAQSARTDDEGQTPPKESQALPTPDNCINESENYNREGNSITYVIALENKCEARLKCKVYAYVVSALGPSQGRTTMVLAPSSKGASAKKSYAMKVKMIGGSAQIARACQLF